MPSSRHRHHAILAYPLVNHLEVEPEESPDLHIWNPSLAHHRVPRIWADAEVVGNLVDIEQPVLDGFTLFHTGGYTTGLPFPLPAERAKKTPRENKHKTKEIVCAHGV